MITSAAIRATEASRKRNKKRQGIRLLLEISSLKSRAKHLCCCLLLPWGLDQFLPAFIFHIHATDKELVKRVFQLYTVTEERLIFLNAGSGETVTPGPRLFLSLQDEWPCGGQAQCSGSTRTLYPAEWEASRQATGQLETFSSGCSK